MTYLYIKAVHIIFIVTWFAGLFYMPRLLIYITESYDKQEPEKGILLRQLKLMASRLWFGITWPSAVLTLGYMHIKLTLVLLLYVYHFSIHYLFKLLRRDVVKYSSQQLRFWNEVATLFLVSIVFLIVLKNALSMVWGLVGLGIITLLILLGMWINKKNRK
jgi:protoporphyrinogen IX oxidase